MTLSIGSPEAALCRSIARHTGASFTNCGRAPTMLTMWYVTPSDFPHDEAVTMVAPAAVDAFRVVGAGRGAEPERHAAIAHPAAQARGIAVDDGVIRHVARHDRARADEAVGAERRAAHDGRVG